MTSLRIDVLISLPRTLRRYLEQAKDVESRVMQLGFQVAALCAADVQTARHDQHPTTYAVSLQALALDKEFDILEDDLKRAFPYESTTTSSRDYPKWYWPLSTHLGNPVKMHTYPSTRAGTNWNMYRVARFKLHCRMLNLDPAVTTIRALPLHTAVDSMMCSNAHNFREAVIFSNLVALVDDICSSVFSLLNQSCEGGPTPIGLDGIRGMAAYILISPLGAARDGIQYRPNFAQQLVSDRLAWIRNTLDVFHKTLGITEAWCWRDEDERDIRRLFQQQLSWDG